MPGRQSGDKPRRVVGCPAELSQGRKAAVVRMPDLTVVRAPRLRRSRIWSGGFWFGRIPQAVHTVRLSTELGRGCCWRMPRGRAQTGRARAVARDRQRWPAVLTSHRRWRHGAALPSVPFISYSCIPAVFSVFVLSHLPMVFLFSAHLCLRSVIRVDILPILLCYFVDSGLFMFAPLFGWRFSGPLDWVALFWPPPIGWRFSHCVCPFYAHSQRQWVSERFETPTSKRIGYTSHCHVGVTVLSSCALLRVVSFGDSQARL